MDDNHDFSVCRHNMRSCLADHLTWAATAKGIEDAAAERIATAHQSRPSVAGFEHDPDYELANALDGNHRYATAVARRNSARERASMWGTAALVEALALIVEDPAPHG